jgi:DNA-binding response OmpR family regulator
MWRVLIIAQESEAISGLRSEIARNGFACSIVPHGDELEDEIIAYRPDLVLVEMNDKLTFDRTLGLIGEFKEKKKLPVIALIDLARCEVTLEGRIVELTFKEYELLKLLAANSGRVYSREVLLDQVWGYDYYGGDRTVDVHVRRLRSKIEDSTHTFIETVRNIGYRFKKSL